MNIRKAKAAVFFSLLVLASLIFTTAVSAESHGGEQPMGAVVIAVVPDSPADNAGLVRGDIVSSFNEIEIGSSAELVDYVDNAFPGDTVMLGVVHGDERFNYAAVLGEQEGGPYLGVYLARDIDLAGEELAEEVDAIADMETAEDVEAEEVEAEAVETEADEVADDADADDTRAEAEDDATESMDETESSSAAVELEPGLKPLQDIANGAFIVDIAADSPAAASGLQVGEVILGIGEKRFTDVDDLVNRVAEYAPGDEIELEVLRRDGTIEMVPIVLAEKPDNETEAFIGVRYGPTPNRMFIGQSDEGGLLVPERPWMHERQRPGSHRWLPYRRR